MQRLQSQLSLAVSKAAADAEVRRIRMARTLDESRVAQLLRAKAQDARLSPLASDQLLALALEAAASPGDFRAPGLDALRQEPDALQQLQLRRDVFAAHDARRAQAVAKAAPDWALRRANREANGRPHDLAGSLRREARLNRELWDHPALPVAPGFRGLMLACVAALKQRADAVARTRLRPRRRDPARGLVEGATA